MSDLQMVSSSPSKPTRSLSGIILRTKDAHNVIAHLLAGPEVLMKLKHLVEEADFGQEHEHERDQNPSVVPRHLIMREGFGNIHDFKPQRKFRSGRE